MTIALSIFLKELNISAGTPKTAANTRGGSLLRDSPMPMLSLADVVFVFRRTGVLHDHYLHVGWATVLEVVEGPPGCENDVADMLVEGLVVAVPVDDDTRSRLRW
jgi:hypothetical protein